MDDITLNKAINDKLYIEIHTMNNFLWEGMILSYNDKYIEILDINNEIQYVCWLNIMKFTLYNESKRDRYNCCKI